MKSTLRLMLLSLILFIAFVPAATGQSSRGAIKKDAGGAATFSVLFFNDLHGNLMPFKITKEDGTSVEAGGIAHIAAMVKKIREENKKKGIPTFLLVAGDMLQGTPMSTVFKGAPDLEIFNAMGVDAMTVGNHEFDFGLENFLALKKAASFPFISSNVVWKESRELVNDPVAVFPLGGGRRLTVIGATTTELLTSTAPSNVEKVDVIDSLETVSRHFNEGIKWGPVILLSHSRYRTDAKIAERIPELTAIIGGHDQVLINPARSPGGVPVFQAFEKGRYLGRIDVHAGGKSRKGAIIQSEYIPITPSLPSDPEVEKILLGYSSRLDATFKEVLGEVPVFMDGERGRIRYEETNLGNFVTDIMREHTGADVALLNAGSLRASLNRGPVTMEDVFKVMPYPNEIIVVKVTGAALHEALTRSVRDNREDEDGGFLHVSGLRFRARGKKVEDVIVGNAPLEPERTYTVTVTDFVYSGGDGHRAFVGKPATMTGLPLRELIVDTIRKRKTVEAAVEGRIVRVGE
ncbi:MAG: 5'-nucleotidase C-terminal domain-containing protein [Spirochaetes bacterium]|nr:5'-nucleotidase C-terminal domain-containing protein [Spirochaetota bacterium]